MDCIDLVLFSWSVLLLALVAKPSQPVWPIQMAFFLSQFWSIRFESSLLNSTLKHITYTVLPIQTFIKGVYSVFSAFSRAETTTSGSGNFSLRGGPFFIPDHRQTSVGEESNGLNKRKGDKRHFTQIDRSLDILTFLSFKQNHFKTFTPGLLGVQHHSEVWTGSQEGNSDPLGITPIHSSAFTAVRQQNSER